MKRVNFISALLINLLVLAICGACSEHNNTIVLPAEGVVSTQVIPTEVRGALAEYMPIYEGTTPPIITGNYLMSPCVLLYTSDGQFEQGYEFADQYMHFGEQENGIIVNYNSKQGGSYSYSNQVQVMGSGNLFTAYFINTTERDFDDDGWNETYTKSSVLFSGILTSDGIENVRYAFIMLEKTDPLDKIMDVNAFRVFTGEEERASRYYGSFAPQRKQTQKQECMEISKSL